MELAEKVPLPTVPDDDTVYNAALVNELILATARVVIQEVARRQAPPAAVPPVRLWRTEK
jgi:hypothetical protein